MKCNNGNSGMQNSKMFDVFEYESLMCGSKKVLCLCVCLSVSAVFVILTGSRGFILTL